MDFKNRNGSETQGMALERMLGQGYTHYCKLIEQNYKPDYDKVTLELQDTDIGYNRGILNNQ